MLEKFFDPFSRLARDANDTNINVYISKISNQDPEIINKIQEQLNEKQYTM